MLTDNSTCMSCLIRQAISLLLLRFRRNLRQGSSTSTSSLLVQLLIVLQLSQAFASPAASSLPFRFRHHRQMDARRPSGLPPYLHRQGLRPSTPSGDMLNMLSRQTYWASPEGDLTVKKRSRDHLELRCGGIYDQSMFAKLEQVCDDCFNLYKIPQVHGMCRADCFGTDTFQDCMQSLLLEENSRQFNDMIDVIGKKKR